MIRCSTASPGQGSSARSAATACRSTAVRPGKRTPSSLRTVDRGTVAADQIAAAPPGGLRRPGCVRSTPRASCSTRRRSGVPGTIRDEVLVAGGQRGPQRPGQLVLRQMQRRGQRRVGSPSRRRRPGRRPVSAEPACRTRCRDSWRRRIVRHAVHGRRRRGRAAEPLQQGGGVRAQHDGAGGARRHRRRPSRRAARRGTSEPGEGERQGEPDRARPDDDHRVHGAVPMALWGVRTYGNWQLKPGARSQNVCNRLRVPASSGDGRWRARHRPSGPGCLSRSCATGLLRRAG